MMNESALCRYKYRLHYDYNILLAGVWERKKTGKYIPVLAFESRASAFYILRFHFERATLTSECETIFKRISSFRYEKRSNVNCHISIYFNILIYSNRVRKVKLNPHLTTFGALLNHILFIFVCAIGKSHINKNKNKNIPN